MSHEAKERLSIRVQPETKKRIEKWYEEDNCRSVNEFVEKAINFYIDYLSIKDATQLLSPALLTAINGRLDQLERSMSSLSFKQCSELGTISNLLAGEFRVDDLTLREYRAESVKNVKQTNGRIDLEDWFRKHKEEHSDWDRLLNRHRNTYGDDRRGGY